MERKGIRPMQHMAEAPCRVVVAIGIQKTHARFANVHFLHFIQHPQLFKKRITEGQQRFPYVIPRELCLFQNQDRMPILREQGGRRRAGWATADNNHIVFF